MPNDLYTGLYNPDVLSCLANLSNDEVFTPPEVANAMLDLLPQELFTSPDTKFLDPACKSGVFLREIAKRLLRGQITDYDQRITEISDKKRRNEPLTSEDAAFLEVLQQRLADLASFPPQRVLQQVSERGLLCEQVRFGRREYPVSSDRTSMERWAVRVLRGK